MPEEQEKFQKNVDDVLEGVMFENWLRFYFLEETEEKDEKGEPKLVMNIPEKGMAKIKEPVSQAVYPGRRREWHASDL